MAEFVDKDHDFASIAEQEHADKLLLLAATMEKQQQSQLRAKKLDCAANSALLAVTYIRFGKKYDKIDVGSSGKLMVERSTGIIYGIKGYGRVHKGHVYGTLDTIDQWYWGLYRPVKRTVGVCEVSI